MRKFLNQKFWSHGTPLGYLGARFALNPTENFSPHIFSSSPEGPETPPGGPFHGGFNFYWPSLQPPVYQRHMDHMHMCIAQSVMVTSTTTTRALKIT